MTFRGIQTAVAPYDDRSGYKADLTLDGAFSIHIKQGEDVVVLSAGEWKQARDAIDKMYAAAGGMMAATDTNGERGSAA